MVNTSVHKSKNGTILFEPFIVYRIHRTLTPPPIVSLNRLIDTAYMFTCPRVSMSGQSTDSPSSLFSMARSKLQSVVSTGVKDSCSLHRWVLLKNSIIRSHSSDAAPAADRGDVSYVCRQDEGTDDAEEVAFMFPDPDALTAPAARSSNSEDEWLDSLLETLGGEDDGLDVEEGEGMSVSALPVDEDDDLLSPLYSPMSSSDDLDDQSSFYINPHAIPIPYPIPYPPLQPPPLVHRWLDLDETQPLYDDPLPYYDADDVDDLPVPDAIEDTSDDESDAPSTPFDQSMSSLSFDPASVPLRRERRRRRSDLMQPQVYIDTDGSHFYPFEFDSLSPHDDAPVDTARVYRPSLVQEC